MLKTAHVFHRVQAQLDVGTILGRAARRKHLDQLDRALQQRIAIAAEILPVAVSAVDGNRPERGGQIDHGLNINQRLLHPKAVVLLAVSAFLAGFAQAGVQVFKVPVKCNRRDGFAGAWAHEGSLSETAMLTRRHYSRLHAACTQNAGHTRPVSSP